jgi:hypothetical protein
MPEKEAAVWIPPPHGISECLRILNTQHVDRSFKSSHNSRSKSTGADLGIVYRGIRKEQMRITESIAAVGETLNFAPSANHVRSLSGSRTVRY